MFVELHAQSAVATGEAAVGGRRHGLLELNDEVTWRARHLGIWQTLRSRIVAYDRPGHFRDSMARGPFARLDHDHYFAEDGRGGTVMRDVFEFAAPLGLLGRVAERLVLTRYLCSFLKARNLAIKSAAESDSASATWPLRLTDPPMVRLGANSMTRCIGTPSWSIGFANRAAILIVGCSLRPRPTCPRMPLRCNNAGVWIAPPHTKT